LSFECWQARFGGDPAMVGKTIVIDGTTFTVIGVFAPKTQVPLGAPDVMVPLGYYPNSHGFDRGVRSISVAGRLRPGVSVEAAQRDLAAISRQLEEDFPATNAATGADVVSLREETVGRVRESLLIILAAVAVVLLIACANVANLQLARGAARARELSTRAALGAGRRRIAQQLLTESVVLSLIGGVAGIGLAVVLKKALVGLVGPTLPVDPSDIRLDVPVLLFALAIAAGTGLLFGVVPAWKASRADLNGMLRSRSNGGLAHVATRNTLVVVQLALSLALLTSAGLITRSLIALEGVNPGFDGAHVLTAQFRLSSSKYDSPEKIMGMFDRSIAEIRSVPGVEAAALVRASPLSQNGESYPVVVEGGAVVKIGDQAQMQLNPVTSGYFATMKIPIIEGRDVSNDDRASALPVIVVNKSFAERTWPGQSALGRRVKIGDENYRTVVGVVGDAKQYTLSEPQWLQGYVPHAQRAQIFTSIVVRARGNPLDLVKPVRDAINRVDKDQPVWRFRSMDQELSGAVGSKKAMMWLTALFAIVALLVSAVGIYGVLSYTMSQRTHEMGIRIALGADGRQVRRMVIGEGARLVGVSVGVGLVASIVAARMLRSQLFGIGANDVVTFVVVTAVLSLVAVLACYLPARRASRVDPMVALRAE
ncbi:MAG: ABC transporter permease, partial [Gemmatimonadaceae bacterium]